jgi:type III secretory pathway component EscR
MFLIFKEFKLWITASLHVTYYDDSATNLARMYTLDDGQVVIKHVVIWYERWGHWIISIDLIFSSRLMALGFTQPLTEMSTSIIKLIMFLGNKVLRVRRADNLTSMCEPII